MLALKCDNCGGYFDYGTDDDINKIAYAHEYTNRHVEYSAYKNLCPECMAAISMALEDRKEATNIHESS